MAEATPPSALQTGGAVGLDSQTSQGGEKKGKVPGFLVHTQRRQYSAAFSTAVSLGAPGR